MENKTKNKLNETRETGVLVVMLQYVATQLSPVSLLARFCTPLEVNFNLFRRLKRGGEKSISKFFSIFLSERHVDSIKQIKNMPYGLFSMQHKSFELSDSQTRIVHNE